MEAELARNEAAGERVEKEQQMGTGVGPCVPVPEREAKQARIPRGECQNNKAIQEVLYKNEQRLAIMVNPSSVESEEIFGPITVMLAPMLM
ncbi:hypothetical protein KM043_004191 [Ampulex compressa]|nr:hypothetical protein KM043_004191 [Ampulex compressa]